MDRTPALGEDESIENSLGNFDIDGTLDVYNVDATGKALYNDAVAGKDKVIQTRVSRKIGDTTYATPDASSVASFDTTK